MTKIVNFFVFSTIFFSSCTTSEKSISLNYFQINGNAQGTTYNIQYDDSLKRNFKPQIDSLLARFDSSLSTYKSNSIISKFNSSDSGFVVDNLFLNMLTNSYLVYEKTEGGFDPSINPLLTFWGFNKEKISNSNIINQSVIDSLLRIKGFDILTVLQNGNEIPISQLMFSSFQGTSFLKKPFKGFQLNFNAIAQGFSVDLVGDFLKENGVKNYMVEIGGEMKVLGVNSKGSDWRLGIDKPVEDGTRSLKAIVNLNKGSLATSGNYRKFYIKDGKKYAHTINPKTGFPVSHNLLSATVIAEDCWMADGLATACMVFGLEWSKNLPKNMEGVNVYLIYSENDEMKTFASNSENWKLEEID
jgi:FAD:protein FMN transferase